jgi:hypothetical protein
VDLYGRAFFADFAKMVADAQRAKVRATGSDLGTSLDLGIPAGPTSSADDAPTGGGNTLNDIFNWITGLGNTAANWYTAVNGGNSGGTTTYVPTGTNNPVYVVQPNGDSGSGSNTALWVIGGVVALVLVVVVIFLTMKK